jgi:hypothetical protein
MCGRQKKLLHVAQANLPELRRQIAVQENALSVLLGRNPGTIECVRGRLGSNRCSTRAPAIFRRKHKLPRSPGHGHGSLFGATASGPGSTAGSPAGAAGLNYAADDRNLDGVVVPTKRKVYRRDAYQQKIPDAVLVAIDIGHISFSADSDADKTIAGRP